MEADRVRVCVPFRLAIFGTGAVAITVGATFARLGRCFPFLVPVERSTCNGDAQLTVPLRFVRDLPEQAKIKLYSCSQFSGRGTSTAT